MVKQGPCYHCGVTTTPLWRNGPPDKPVLCNACGSRWRTKGTLENYMPMHAGGFGSGIDGSVEIRWPRATKQFVARDQHSNKRKNPYSDYLGSESAFYSADPAFSKNVDSNRSSLGSTISSSEASMCPGNVSGAEFPVHKFWDTHVPSRKRTMMVRSRVFSEKMTGSLMAIEEPEVSSVSCPYNDPFVHNRSPLVAFETGLGGVLLRQRPSATREPESEVSSFLSERNGHELVYDIRQNSAGGLVTLGKSNTSFSQQCIGKEDNMKGSEAGQFPSVSNFISNKALLKNFSYDKHNVLQSSQSPLVFLDMKDIVNLDTFTSLLSSQEQAQLMKLLAPVDTTSKTESLKQLLGSSQFEAALKNFQWLLSEGMFDSSDPCWNFPLLKHLQQLFVLRDLGTSGWMEKYFQLQGARKCEGSAEKIPEFRQDYNLFIAAVSPYTGPTEFESSPGRLSCQSLKKLSTQGHRISGGFSSTVTSDEQDSDSDLDLLINIPSSRSFQEAELLQYP